MSPEQATGDRQLDARSDVYSLGAVLYEMLAGEPPVTGPTVQAIIAKLMTERPTRLRVIRDTVPEGVDNAVARALAKVPPDRFQDVGAFVRALEAGPLAAEAFQPRPRRWGRLAGGISILAALGLGALLLRHTAKPTSPKRYDRVQLTATGKGMSPVLSPDGSQIAYLTGECTEAGDCKYRIVTRDIATGAERTLVENLGWSVLEQWSPDGVRLLYYTWGLGNPGGTYGISRLGGAPTYLGLGAGGFLNGGDTVVVAAQLGATSAVFLRRFILPSSKPFDSIAVVKPGNVTTLRGLSISPNGHWIALGWSGGGQGLLSLHSRSGALISSVWSSEDFASLVWSPDSRALITPANVAGREGTVLRFWVDPETGQVAGAIDTIGLGSGSGAVVRVGLSGDGHLLAYQADREGETALWSLLRTVSGSTIRPIRKMHIASSRFEGFVSRDGRMVFYSEKTLASGKLLTQWFVAPFDSGVAHPVTPPLADVVDFTATQDAGVFYIATRSPGGGSDITAYDVASGSSRPFNHQQSDGIYIWESSAGGVVLISGGGDSLTILDAGGHEVRHIIIPDSIPKLVSLFWSPDGREFVIYPQAPVKVGSDGNFEVKLYRISVADAVFHLIGTVKVVYLEGQPWTNDGYLHFEATTATEPRFHRYRLRPEGGRPEVEGLSPFPFVAASCRSANDGRRWTCVVPQTLSDLYLIRNFDPSGL